MDQLICASLSHTHYWYEVGVLKVPAVSDDVDAQNPVIHAVANPLREKVRGTSRSAKLQLETKQKKVKNDKKKGKKIKHTTKKQLPTKYTVGRMSRQAGNP